jgi:hypothetical protein
MSSVAILFVIGFLFIGINIYWNGKLFTKKQELEDRERTLIHRATEGSQVKERMLDFVREFEDAWLIPYRNEPDKQFIGLGKLRTNILIWFGDHNGGDAINIIDELLSDISKQLPVSRFRDRLEKRLGALKDTLERGIV